MNYKFTRTILPAAALFLLSALMSSGTPHSFSTKDAYINDPVLSADVLPPDGLGRPDGDDHQFSLAHHESTSRLPLSFAAFGSIPAPAADFAHTVSQARAPPLS